MELVAEERVNRLDEILQERRRRLGFRCLITACVIVFYTGGLGLPTTLGWAAIYGGLQAIEHLVLSPRNRRLIESPAGYWAALGLLFASAMVFGSLALIWPFRSGPWGVANGAFLIAGAMLNTVLTTLPSRAVFRALALPLFFYGVTLPIAAKLTGADTGIVVGLVVGIVLLGFTALKLWSQTHDTMQREKAAVAELERRRAEAESAVAAKSAFVAMVSHELRTPISAILAGATELERISGGVGRQHARLISDAGAMMRTLLNDLLDLAKLDAGRMAVENVGYDFRALMADQMRFWRAEAMKKSLSLRLTGARAAPGWVLGDPMRLRQILNNLLSNALKFTEAGSVTVSIASTAMGDGRTRLEIEVCDTGPGMTAEQLDRLFQPFEQADSSIARTHGGTGLGLVISRQLARMMDGDIRVESAHGHGSRFTVSLVVDHAEPLAPAAMIEDGPMASPSAMSVLVVDDHEINRRAITLMLEPLGAEVSLAASGGDALNLLAMRPYDVVLMDVHMPDMTGREVVVELRRIGGPNQVTPVIAVTGATEPADVQACLASGMNDWVAKPIDAGQLYNALARQLGQGDEDEAVAA